MTQEFYFAPPCDPFPAWDEAGKNRARGGASSSSFGCSSLILTGAGKTYGMEGPSIMEINEQERDLVSRVVDGLFDCISLVME
ncbi:hypothetical protein ACLB2K_041204 [Fragaria x ananassa]